VSLFRCDTVCPVGFSDCSNAGMNRYPTNCLNPGVVLRVFSWVYWHARKIFMHVFCALLLLSSQILKITCLQLCAWVCKTPRCFSSMWVVLPGHACSPGFRFSVLLCLSEACPPRLSPCFRVRARVWRFEYTDGRSGFMCGD
jgi:hypothetical protein